MESLTQVKLFFIQILTDPKSQNYGNAGEATPDNKAKRKEHYGA